MSSKLIVREQYIAKFYEILPTLEEYFNMKDRSEKWDYTFSINPQTNDLCLTRVKKEEIKGE